MSVGGKSTLHPGKDVRSAIMFFTKLLSAPTSTNPASVLNNQSQFATFSARPPTLFPTSPNRLKV
jgi:hypothetical protein